jgi:hypothetical protein
MDRILNIVNGDIVLNNMRVHRVAGDFLAWGDFLYDGAVSEGLSLEELSKTRARFISNKGLGEFEKIYQEFKDRNSTLKSFKKYDKIFLWFESDIYDQLQLIQILDWFAKYSSTDSKIYIIYPENYLAISSRDEIGRFLLYNKEPVTHTHFITARKAWSAFSSSTPYAFHKLLNDDIDELPFLKDTIKRVLEEYPNSINGLSRTGYQALLSIFNGYNNPKDIFNDYQKSEERAFMGEIIFFHLLRGLAELNLLNSMEDGQKLELTTLGKDILKAKKNLFDHKRVDRWIGGVNITNKNPWCWDIETQNIIEYKNGVSMAI